MLRLGSLALAAIIGAALALAVGLSLTRLGIGSWFAPQTHTESTSIIEQIRLVAKLQTVEYSGATTVKLEKEDWKGSRSTVYVLEGIVPATVDLQKMTFEVDARSARRTVRITLPNVVVENPVVRRLEIVMSCHSFLTAPELSDADRNELHQRALIDLKLAAIRNGIRDKAVRQAQDYLTTFLSALGYQAVFV